LGNVSKNILDALNHVIAQFRRDFRYISTCGTPVNPLQGSGQLS
jgi:hypothetical protein